MSLGARARIALLAVLLATIGCDRVTKHVATTTLAGTPARSYLADTVRLTYSENTGGFLGLGAGLPPAVRTALFSVGTGIALAALAFAALRRRWGGLPLLGLTLFVAGGISNWIDRVAHGGVVDFLNLGIGPVRTGIFNVADVAIMAGAAIFLFEEMRAPRAEPTAGPPVSVGDTPAEH
jgi:signal peptidase II